MPIGNWRTRLLTVSMSTCLERAPFTGQAITAGASELSPSEQQSAMRTPPSSRHHRDFELVTIGFRLLDSKARIGLIERSHDLLGRGLLSVELDLRFAGLVIDFSCCHAFKLEYALLHHSGTASARHAAYLQRALI